MNKSELLSLYERMYFHELDVKEKISTRVQLSFALFLLGATVSSYMIRMLDYSSSEEGLLAFYLFFCASLFMLARGVWLLAKAFSGDEYLAVATADKIDGYRDEYAAYVNSLGGENERSRVRGIDDEVSEYLYCTFKTSTTHNALLNQKRSEVVHKAYSFFLKASWPLVVSGIIFVVADMDAASPRKESVISSEEVAQQLGAINASVITLGKKLDLNLTELLKKMTEKKSAAPVKTAAPPAKPPVRPGERSILEHQGPKSQVESNQPRKTT